MKAIGVAKAPAMLEWQRPKALDVLSAACPVSLIWVPGRAGIKGNEKADVLSKKGPGDQLICREPVLGMSTRCIREYVIGWMTNQYLTPWKNISGSQRQYHNLI
jgi:hypothetical protein